MAIGRPRSTSKPGRVTEDTVRSDRITASATPVEARPEAVPGLGVVQLALAVGAADDPLEVEAERVAAEVVAVLRRRTGRPVDHDHHGAPAAAPLAAPPTAVRESLLSPATTGIARRADTALDDSSAGPAGGPAPAAVDAHVGRTAGRGTPLPDDLSASMGAAFGSSFDDVRIHTDAATAASAQAIGAKAYTTGRDIYFGAGAYAPNTSSGQHLLAHELTHVVQQRGAGPVRRHRKKAGYAGQQLRLWSAKLQEAPTSLTAADADLLAQTFAGKGPSITTLQALGPLITAGWTAASVTTLIRRFVTDPGGKTAASWAILASTPALTNRPDDAAVFARIGDGWTAGALAALASAYVGDDGGLTATEWAGLAVCHDDVINQAAPVAAFARLAAWSAANKRALLSEFCTDAGTLTATQFVAIAAAHAALGDHVAHVATFARLAGWGAAHKTTLAVAWATGDGTLTPADWAQIATTHARLRDDAAGVAGFARLAGWSAPKKVALALAYGTDPATRTAAEWAAIAGAHAGLADLDVEVTTFARIQNGWTAANLATLAGLFGADPGGRPATEWKDIAVADAELADEEELVAALSQEAWVTTDVGHLFTGVTGAAMGAAALVALLKVDGTPKAGRAMVVAGWTATHLGTFLGTLHAGALTAATSAEFLATPGMPAATFLMRTPWTAAELGEMVVGAHLAGSVAATIGPLLATATFAASSHALVAGAWTARRVGEYCGAALVQGVVNATFAGLLAQVNAPAAHDAMTTALWTQRRLGTFVAAALALGVPTARLQELMQDGHFPAGSHTMEAGAWATLVDLAGFVGGINSAGLAVADIGALVDTPAFSANSHLWRGAGYPAVEVGTICGRARLYNGGGFTAAQLTTFLGTGGAAANARALNWWSAAEVGDTVAHCRTQAGAPTDVELVQILQHAATPANGLRITPAWTRNAATGDMCGAPNWGEFLARTPTFQASWTGPAARANQPDHIFNGTHGGPAYRVLIELRGERISHVEKGHTFEYHDFSYANCTRVGVGVNGFASFEPAGSTDPYVTNRLIGLQQSAEAHLRAENAAWANGSPTQGFTGGYKIGVLNAGGPGPGPNPIYPTYLSQAYPTAGIQIRGKVLVAIGRFFGRI